MADVELPEILTKRREECNQRLADLRGRLADSENLVRDVGCVYATGSLARGEASSHSDLDLFILSQMYEDRDGLSRTEEILLLARLIEVTREAGFPEFTGDGEYLVPYRVSGMIEKLGTREDDYENLFTARILLLLESQPLLGDAAYETAIRRIVDSYWRDYEGNEASFLPTFLVNDIARYWKVLCVNYEAYTKREEVGKRRLNNYKLKHSRLLTCYSALLYLCWLLGSKPSITPEDAVAMTALRPLERLETIARQSDSSLITESVARLFGMYARFLSETEMEKSELRKRFQDANYHDERRAESREFGDEIFRLLQEIGSETQLYRYLMV